MMELNKAIAELRLRIRGTKQQFRHNNDNSESLFHPAGGFIYAYESSAVDAALDWFEGIIDTDLELNA